MQQFKTTKPVGAHPVYWHSFREVPPTDWQIKIMAEFAETFKGKLSKRLIETPTPTSRPYLLMDGLDNGNHVYTEDDEVPHVTEKDSLMIADGSRSGLAIRGFSGARGSTLLAFRVKEGVDHDYMFHLLSSLYAYLSATTAGSAIPHLDKSLLAKLKLATPVCEEQKAIATILDAVDTSIERTRTAIDKAKRLKRSLIQELFSKGIGHIQFKKTEIGQVPSSWNVMKVGVVIVEAQYGLSIPMHSKGRYPILRMAAIQDGDVLLDDLKYVDLPDKVADTYLLQQGDVLFNRTNSADWVGKVGIYRSDKPAVFASYLIRLKINPDVVDNYFLGQLLTSK